MSPSKHLSQNLNPGDLAPQPKQWSHCYHEHSALQFPHELIWLTLWAQPERWLSIPLHIWWTRSRSPSHPLRAQSSRTCGFSGWHLVSLHICPATVEEGHCQGPVIIGLLKGQQIFSWCQSEGSREWAPSVAAPTAAGAESILACQELTKCLEIRLSGSGVRSEWRVFRVVKTPPWFTTIFLPSPLPKSTWCFIMSVVHLKGGLAASEPFSSSSQDFV